MQVARHEAERVTAPAESGQRETQKRDEQRSVASGYEEVELPNGSAADVIDAARHEETRSTAHASSVGAG